MGRPKMVAPPPPPPAPPPPTPMALMSTAMEYSQGSARRIKKKRRGISSLRISSGTNTNSSGTGVNV